MFKQRLFTPGPTPIPEKVELRMAEPIIHHRSSAFTAILDRVNKNLQYLFQTSGPVLILTSSGTGGVEATFVSLFSTGDTVIAVNGGKFGERWVAMPKKFGLNAVELKVAWGSAPSERDLLDLLRRHPEAKAVYLTHSETSTGAATDVKRLARVIRENSRALVCVDGITAIGAHELRFDEWGIDVCVTGSQKGLMIPPGLAFVALSPRAVDQMASSNLPSFYFNLRKAHASWQKNDTPWTPAASLVIGVDEALGMIRAEGIENVWRRHERLATAVRAGIRALGLRLFSEVPSYAVTPVWLPETIAWKTFNHALKETYGITVAGGQDEYAGKIFRISHLGYYDDFDMLAVIGGIERTLADCGWKFEPGSGVRAAQEVFLKRSAPGGESA
jgi:aspartate aminotransferase-like enzyme